MPSTEFTVNINVVTKDLTSRAAKTATKSLTGLQKAAKLAALAYAAFKAAQKAIEFVKFGAQVQRAAGALNNLARAAGTSGDAIVRSIQTASDFTVDRMSAMQSANRALLMGVAKTPAEFAKLAEYATKLGRAMGLDAKQSIDDFVTAAGRQSIMIADNLGIVMSAEDAYKRYAEANNIATSAMTKQQKSAAFLQEMLRQAARKTADLGDETDSLAIKFDKLDAAMADAKAGLAEVAVEAIDVAIGVDLAARAIRTVPDAARALLTVPKLFLLLNNAIWGVTGASEELRLTWKSTTDWAADVIDRLEGKAQRQEKGWRDRANALNAYAANVEYAALAHVELTGQFGATDAATLAYLDSLGETEEMLDGFRNTASGIVEVIRSQAQAYADLTGSLKDATGAQIAQQAISQLGALLEEGKITTDEYRTAVMETQLAFGLADKASILLADQMLSLTTRFGEGAVAADAYDDELTKLVKANEALKQSIDNLPDEKRIKIIVELATPSGTGALRQHGGPVKAGAPYIVGEAGPELFVPGASGHIYNQQQTTRIIGSNNRNTYNFPDARAMAFLSARERAQSRQAFVGASGMGA